MLGSVSAVQPASITCWYLVVALTSEAEALALLADEGSEPHRVTHGRAKARRNDLGVVALAQRHHQELACGDRRLLRRPVDLEHP